MSALKLFRRGAPRPSLKERAAKLKATASRVIRRPKPVEAEPETDWENPPEGFMAYPVGRPAAFILIREGLRLEAERLHEIALHEVARRASMGDLGTVAKAGRLDRLRRQHRVEALGRAAALDPAIPTESILTDGTVYYEDACGTAHRRSVAEWIGFMAHRMNSVARQEASRLYDIGASQNEAENDILLDGLCRAHRLDALHNLAHRADAVFEASKGHESGKGPVAPRVDGASMPDPILALIERHRQAYAEWFPFMEVVSELVGGTPEYARARADERGPAEREQAAYAMVLSARPTSPTGLIAWAGYLPQALAGNSVNPDEDGVRALASLCDAVLSLTPIVAPRPARDLADQLVSGWAEWAKLSDEQGSSRDEPALDRASKIRNELLLAAGNLPATPPNIPAKAIASAWISFVCLEQLGAPREAYTLDGQLTFDIDTAARVVKHGVAGEHPDAALITLGVELEAADARMKAADTDCDARISAATAAMPERPSALTFREADRPFNLQRDGRYVADLEGTPIILGDIAWMTRRPACHEIKRPVRPGERAWHDLPGHVLDVVPWPEAQARIDEIVAAWEAWSADQRAIDEAHGISQAEALCDAAHAETKAILDRMAALPARTVEGMHIKLRAFQDAVPHMRGANWGELMLRSLMRDAGVTIPETDVHLFDLEDEMDA